MNEPTPGMHSETPNTSENSIFSPESKVALDEFLIIARTDGPESQLACGAVGRLHEILQNETASMGEEREIWFNTRVLAAYINAAKINSAYDEMAKDAKEDLEMVLGQIDDEELRQLLDR